MVSDRELWACAAAVLRDRADGAEPHIESRISQLRERGDVAGVDAWRGIGDRVLRLRQGTDTVRH